MAGGFVDFVIIGGPAEPGSQRRAPIGQPRAESYTMLAAQVGATHERPEHIPEEEIP
jgi:hypothetical protein